MTSLFSGLFPFKEPPARHHTPASLKPDTYARHPLLDQTSQQTSPVRTRPAGRSRTKEVTDDDNH